MLPVSLAIRPITVLSPVFTTIPVQVPVYGDDLVTVRTNAEYCLDNHIAHMHYMTPVKLTF